MKRKHIKRRRRRLVTALLSIHLSRILFEIIWEKKKNSPSTFIGFLDNIKDIENRLNYHGGYFNQAVLFNALMPIYITACKSDILKTFDPSICKENPISWNITNYTIIEAIRIVRNAIVHLSYIAKNIKDKTGKVNSYFYFQADGGCIKLSNEQIPIFVEKTKIHINNSSNIDDVYKHIINYSFSEIEFMRILNSNLDSETNFHRNINILLRKDKYAQYLFTNSIWTIESIFTFIPHLFLYISEDDFSNIKTSKYNSSKLINIRNSMAHSDFIINTNNSGEVKYIEFDNNNIYTTNELNTMYIYLFDVLDTYIREQIKNIDALLKNA